MGSRLRDRGAEGSEGVASVRVAGGVVRRSTSGCEGIQPIRVRMDLTSIRDGRELPDPGKPEECINPLFKLLQDHRDDKEIAHVIDEIESTWRKFERVWDGRWRQEPPEDPGVQCYDANHVVVNLRIAYERLAAGRKEAQPYLNSALKAAQDLLAREPALAARRLTPISGPPGGSDDPSPEP